jgi:hypothetical protein
MPGSSHPWLDPYCCISVLNLSDRVHPLECLPFLCVCHPKLVFYYPVLPLGWLKQVKSSLSNSSWTGPSQIQVSSLSSDEEFRPPNWRQLNFLRTTSTLTWNSQTVMKIAFNVVVLKTTVNETVTKHRRIRSQNSGVSLPACDYAMRHKYVRSQLTDIIA